MKPITGTRPRGVVLKQHAGNRIELGPTHKETDRDGKKTKSKKGQRGEI